MAFTMSPLFYHADKRISNDHDPDHGVEWVELETNSNPQLRKMMIYLREDQNLFSTEELSKLGVTVITLPAAESLFSDEGPFRPHPPFGTDKTATCTDGFAGESAENSGRSYMSLPANLQSKSHEMFTDVLLSKGVYDLDTICPWRHVQYVLWYLIL